MLHRLFLGILVVSLLAIGATPVWAQVPGDDTRPPRFQLGPLGLTPRLFIQNLGVDTNVFNAGQDPVRDLTATVTPGLDASIRMNRVVLTSRTSTDWVHYQRTSSQRSLNFTQDWRIDVDLVPATPRLLGAYTRTRQRPNDEVDVRVQQKLVSGGVGATVPVGSRWQFDLDARRTRHDFSEGLYGDVAIAEALNRDSDEIRVTGRVELTPLTWFTVRAESIRDRFSLTPARDSDSVRIMPGFTFHPFALISGSAFAGVRRFRTLDPLVPDYTGLVAAVELKYVARDMFRITAKVSRDVDYSLDLAEPFYISTSAGAEITQMLGLNWDVMARLRAGTLDYLGLAAAAPRTDTVRVIGAGFGRRIGEALRVGVDVDHLRRSSPVPGRAFEGLRFGGSLTYGY